MEPTCNAAQNGVSRAVSRPSGTREHEVLEALRGVAPANNARDDGWLMRESVEGENRQPVSEAVQLQRNDPVCPWARSQADMRGDLDDLGRTWCR